MAQPDLKRLRSLVADKVQSLVTLRMIAHDAGFDLTRFPADASDLNQACYALLAEAHRIGPAMFESLLDELVHWYPGDTELRRFWREAWSHPNVHLRSGTGFCTTSEWGAPDNPPAAWGEYRLKAFIPEGGGALGVVYLARPLRPLSVIEAALPSPQVAVKILKPQQAGERARQTFMREMQALTSLRHPFVVSVHRVGEELGQGGHPLSFVEMEYMPEGSLQLHLGLKTGERRVLGQQDALSKLRGIASALRHLHEDHALLHRDIKPSNLLVHHGVLKLADFGLALHTSELQTARREGSPWFMAPEQLQGEGKLSPATDLFAVGAVLWTCLSRAWPPPPQEAHGVAQLRQPARIPILRWEEVAASPDLRQLHPRVRELLADLLQADPEARIGSARDLLQRMDAALEALILTPHQERWEAALKDRDKQLQAEKADHAVTQAEREAARTAANTQKKAMERRVSELQARLRASEETGLSLTQQLETARRAQQALDAVLADQDKPYRAERSAHATTRTQLEEARRSLEALDAALKDKEQLLQAEKASQAATLTQLDVALQHNQSLEAELKHLDQKYLAEKTAHGATREQLAGALAEVEGRANANSQRLAATVVVAVFLLAAGIATWSDGVVQQHASGLTSSPAPATPAPPSPKEGTCPAGYAYIKAGSFKYQDKELKQVEAFCMGKTEVTVAQYQRCVDAKVCTPANDKTTSTYCNTGYPDRSDHPINCVDYTQATAYAQSKGGRLPTEVEWEYAARGEEGRTYPWGDSPAPSCDYAVFDTNSSSGTVDRTDGCGLQHTDRTCSRPNGNTPGGVCDMAGNVWEWTSDWYTTGSSRVLRGGSWGYDAWRLRAAYRNGLDPSRRNDYVGFRVVLPPPG